MVETVTAFIFAIACLALARWKIQNPITRTAAYLTGCTVLGLVAASTGAELVSLAMAS